MDNGMARAEYRFFMNNNLKHHSIMGNDYYAFNEHMLAADGSLRASGEVSSIPSSRTNTTTATGENL